jgi:hypothetical protein
MKRIINGFEAAFCKIPCYWRIDVPALAGLTCPTPIV